MRDTKNRVLSAVRTVFVAMASLLIRNGINANSAVEQLKIAFVLAARKEHGRAGKPASVSRISHLTGLGRKHVSDLIEKSSRAASREEMAITRESEILTKWWTSPDYLDDAGLPKALEIGPGPGSFAELVEKSTGSNATQEHMKYIKSLQNSGAIELRDGQKVAATNRGFRIDGDLPRTVCINLATLAETISRNWGMPRSETFCQRAAHSGKVQSQSISALRRISKEQIKNLLTNIDDILSNLESDDDEPTISPEGRELLEVGVGAYYFEIEKDT